VSFWEKFVRTKVVEREIPDERFGLRFPLRCTVREIFSKNWKNFELGKLNFQSSNRLQNLISSSPSQVLITTKISSRLVNSNPSYRVRKKCLKNELKALKLSFLCSELYQKLISSSPSSTTPTVKISAQSVHFNERKRVRKKKKSVKGFNKQTNKQTNPDDCNSGFPLRGSPLKTNKTRHTVSKERTSLIAQCTYILVS
jgi:hypothetical protein